MPFLKHAVMLHKPCSSERVLSAHSSQALYRHRPGLFACASGRWLIFIVCLMIYLFAFPADGSADSMDALNRIKEKIAAMKDEISRINDKLEIILNELEEIKKEIEIEKRNRAALGEIADNYRSGRISLSSRQIDSLNYQLEMNRKKLKGLIDEYIQRSERLDQLVDKRNEYASRKNECVIRYREALKNVIQDQIDRTENNFSNDMDKLENYANHVASKYEALADNLVDYYRKSGIDLLKTLADELRQRAYHLRNGILWGEDRASVLLGFYMDADNYDYNDNASINRATQDLDKLADNRQAQLNYQWEIIQSNLTDGSFKKRLERAETALNFKLNCAGVAKTIADTADKLMSYCEQIYQNQHQIIAQIPVDRINGDQARLLSKYETVLSVYRKMPAKIQQSVNSVKKQIKFIEKCSDAGAIADAHDVIMAKKNGLEDLRKKLTDTIAEENKLFKELMTAMQPVFLEISESIVSELSDQFAAAEKRYEQRIDYLRDLQRRYEYSIFEEKINGLASVWLSVVKTRDSLKYLDNRIKNTTNLKMRAELLEKVFFGSQGIREACMKTIDNLDAAFASVWLDLPGSVNLTRKDSIDILTLAKQGNPDSAKVNFLLGYHSEMAGNYETAEACYLKCIEIQPEDPDYPYHLARVHSLMGKTSDADSYYNHLENALLCQYHYAYPYLMHHLKKNDLDTGMAKLSHLSGQQAHPENLLYTMAMVYSAAGDLEKSTVLLDQALSITDNSDFIVQKLINRASDPSGVPMALKSAADYPDTGAVISQAGWTLFLNGRPEQGIKLLDDYLKSNVCLNSLYFRTLMAMLYNDQAALDQCRQKTQELDDPMKRLFFNAWHLSVTGNFVKAEHLMDIVYTKTGWSFAGLEQAFCLARSGNFDQAYRLCDVIYKNERLNADMALALMAQINLEQGDIDAFEKCINAFLIKYNETAIDWKYFNCILASAKGNWWKAHRYKHQFDAQFPYGITGIKRTMFGLPRALANYQAAGKTDWMWISIHIGLPLLGSLLCLSLLGIMIKKWRQQRTCRV